MRENFSRGGTDWAPGMSPASPLENAEVGSARSRTAHAHHIQLCITDCRVYLLIAYKLCVEKVYFVLGLLGYGGVDYDLAWL